MSKSQVVVAYDFSTHADVAMQRAIELAIREPDHVLHFVTVLDERHDGHQHVAAATRDILGRARALFDARQASAEIELVAHARVGSAVPEILKVAEEVGADLIICGSHGRGALGRLLIGSVSEGVLHGARCPVTVVRLKGYAYVNPRHSSEDHAPAQRLAEAVEQRSRHVVMRA